MATLLGPATARLPFSLDAAADLLWAAVTGLGVQAAADRDPERVDLAFAGLRRLIAITLEVTTQGSPPP